MGISVAYSGRLRDPGLVPELVGDLKARAQSAGWLCKTMEELVAEGLVTCSGLEGITLYPHLECEPLHFHFDGEGTFTNHTYHALLGDKQKAAMMLAALAESAALMRGLTKGSRKGSTRGGRTRGGGGAPYITIGLPDMPEAPGMELFQKGTRYNWTKTQFAGPKVHIAVCAILRYVKQRYAPELEVTDDSGYFRDGDEAKLEAEMGYVDRLTSLTSQAIETVTASGVGSMTLDKFVARLNEELAQASNKLH